MEAKRRRTRAGHDRRFSNRSDPVIDRFHEYREKQAATHRAQRVTREAGQPTPSNTRSVSDDVFYTTAKYPAVMRLLSVELDEETLTALEAERIDREFDSRSAYVRWLIEQRHVIEDGERPDRASDQARIDEFDAPPGSTHAACDGERATTPSSCAVPDTNTRPADTDGGWTRAPASTERERRGSSTADTGDASRNRGEIDAVNVRPERIDRIPGDPIADDADVLGTVEGNRLDELTRRAVAKTRKRLKRDVQTGLEYTSSTRLAGDDVRPGEDVVDLDRLEVPGRTAADVRARREAAGRAIAYLRDEGRARRSDIVEALFEEVPAGYETKAGWWRCIKTALKQVDSIEGGEGARVWRYDGPH